MNNITTLNQNHYTLILNGAMITKNIKIKNSRRIKQKQSGSAKIVPHLFKQKKCDTL